MDKRKEIIEILKKIKPSMIENNGPTAIFITDDRSRKINITGLSVKEDFIIVNTGKYLFKRKYYIRISEL